MNIYPLRRPAHPSRICRMLMCRLVEPSVAQDLERHGLAVMLRADAREPYMGAEIAGVMCHGDHFPHGLRPTRCAEALPDRDAVIVVRTMPAPPHAHHRHPPGVPRLWGTAGESMKPQSEPSRIQKKMPHPIRRGEKRRLSRLAAASVQNVPG